MIINNYITKIKSNITIYATKKTSNILDGEYKSIYKGRSMDFDDLRNYIMGDDIKDIDWKSSARAGSMLVRRYIAEKKHNIMLVLDTGIKMLADTKLGEAKKEVAIMSAGIMAYLADKNGDYVGAIYNKDEEVIYNPFRNGLYNIEKILTNYEKDIEKSKTSNLESILEYLIRHIKRKMIIVVITDIEGMENIQENTLKNLAISNDIMFINISDAYMTGENSYNVDENFYIPEIILKDIKLQELEKEAKEKIYKSCLNKLKKYRISTTTVDTDKEIVTKIIELLERHKYANSR